MRADCPAAELMLGKPGNPRVAEGNPRGASDGETAAAGAGWGWWGAMPKLALKTQVKGDLGRMKFLDGSKN